MRLAEMTNLSADVREYLKRCGLSDSKLAQCNESTRMYHDLDLYGDIAEAYMEVLGKQYQVDLANFQFEKFFPTEFQGKNMLTRTLLWLIPFANMASRQRNNYQPLTLSMIDRAIRTKHWQD